MFERPLNRIEPLRIFEGPVNEGRARCIQWWFDLVFHLLRQQPLGRVVRQVIEEILRLPQGHDVANHITVNVCQLGVGKQRTHSVARSNATCAV